MTTKNAKRLRFAVTTTESMKTMRELHSRFLPAGHRVLNRTEWRGHEPRTCAVTHLSSRAHSANDPSPVEIDLEVTYLPKGYISYVGNTKYDSWTPMILDRAADGALLDGNGKPLQDGQEPVYKSREIFGDADFNELNFGTFVEEVDIDLVKRAKVDDVLEELKSSGGGSFGVSVDSFIAPHRSRQLKKIVISNQPNFSAIDGFGTHVVNINQNTPHLEFILMERMADLMCEFIEGKASIKCFENKDLCFVELSDSLVDCAPNEVGFDSVYDVLHHYTPVDFLEDLAKRLMSIYKIRVSIIEGPEGGLVLRRE